jgi:hypothetical protein
MWCGGVGAQDGKARYTNVQSMEPKITFSEIFIFQPILEFLKNIFTIQKHTEANAVELSTFQ